MPEDIYRDLYCPYCGNGLEIEKVLELNQDEEIIIICESYTKCGAKWSCFGTIRVPSKLVVDKTEGTE